MPRSWSFAPPPQPTPAPRPSAPAPAAAVPDPPAAAVDVVATQYQPADHTVGEVQAYVGEHPDELEAVLALEEIGKGRKSLIAWLTDLQAHYAQQEAADTGDADNPPDPDD